LRCLFAIWPFNSKLSFPPILEETALHDAGDKKSLNSSYEVCKFRAAILDLLILGLLALPSQKGGEVTPSASLEVEIVSVNLAQRL
jgi:hypothetical protein